MTNTPSKKNINQTATLPKFKKDKKGEWYIPQPEGNESISQQCMRVFGTQDSDALDYLMAQVFHAIGYAEEKKQHEGFNKMLPLIQSIAPQDELESMLAVQMVGIQTMAMEMMKRAMISDQTVDGVSNNVNRVTKLTRTFIALMEALDKHRGRGQQKITVEHVTVNKGGQAIVGNVEQGGRDEKKK